jgi:signal peptidase I
VRRRRWWIWAVVLCVLAGCGRSYSSGDRVLVAKFLYETNLAAPRRFDIVVFKFPETPVRQGVPRNYIKRLLGLPGEILAIFFGQLFRIPAPEPGQPPDFNDFASIPEIELWERPYTHMNDAQMKRWFQQGGIGQRKLEPVRKSPDVMLAMRRPVYNNDYPAKDLLNKVPPRWQPADKSGWSPDTRHGFRHDGPADTTRIDWVRYQHLVVERGKGQPIPPDVKPILITDFMDYNSFTEAGRDPRRPPAPNWVGDLMLECELNVLDPKGEFAIELNRGIYRYQARWDLATGTCSLVQVDVDNNEKQLESKSTSVKKKGTFKLRFANSDSRLTVWVDSDLPFGNGHDYTPPEMPQDEEKDLSPERFAESRAARCGPTPNDLKPASVGSRGAAVEVHHLRLWRDTHYTLRADVDPGQGDADRGWDPADPNTWGPLKRVDFTTMYVQPRHYLVLGDNSPASSDSRTWGTVPERLLLGRALAVYYPFDRFGPIR